MISAAILGASGYSGAELLRLLGRRDDVRIAAVIANASVGRKVSEIYPAFAGECDLSFQPLDQQGFDGIDVAFSALPSGESMKAVPNLLNTIPRVIDLSGDFRLASPGMYRMWYAHEHAAPDLLGSAVYGLPEINRKRIAAASLVANPGCYPTCAILALLPALKHGIVSAQGITVNSLSGVSGAGRQSSVEYSFTEVNENARAYKIGRHQHIPEMESVLAEAADAPVSLSFVPHLVPLTRGMYTTIHANLAVTVKETELFELYDAFYRSEPFVRVVRQVPQIRDVVRTNYCDISLAVEPRTKQLILTSVIDNLVKGAAGQAVQNMNLMFGLPEDKGLK